jgi:hypothetical protein
MMMVSSMVPITIGRHVVVDANHDHHRQHQHQHQHHRDGMPISMSTTIGGCSRSVAAA